MNVKSITVRRASLDTVLDWGTLSPCVSPFSYRIGRNPVAVIPDKKHSLFTFYFTPLEVNKTELPQIKWFLA